MASFYHATVVEFLAQTNEYILARLATAYANRGYTSQYSDQTLTWERDLRSLRVSLEHCARHPRRRLLGASFWNFPFRGKSCELTLCCWLGRRS